MSFDSPNLRQLVSVSDEQAFLWRTLLQSLADQGGDVRHLNGLLSDMRGPRFIIGKMAKLMMGPVWTLAEKPVELDLDLDPENFTCSPDNFLKRFPKQAIAPNLVGRFTETQPSRSCVYKLEHFSERPSFKQIMGVFKEQPGIEHAGWRELVAYVSKIEKNGWEGGRPIIAAGSRIRRENPAPRFWDRLGVDVNEDPIFATNSWYHACQPILSTLGVRDVINERFDTNCFYLIRVYE